MIVEGLIPKRFRRQWRLRRRANKLLSTKQLTMIGWAAAVGISVGSVAAVVSIRRPTPTVSTPYIVPVRDTTADVSAQQKARAEAEQVERLKTRNRRLEALVSVLRRRAGERQ